MARYAFVVHTNPVQGREDEYNRWYSGRHLQDLLQCPGVISARRFKVAGPQVRDTPPPHQYLAIYEVETDDDPQIFINELLARAGTELLPTCAALAPDSSAVFWEALK